MKQIEHDEIKLELEGMLFTWNDEKEQLNIRKHGVDFRAAARVFLDSDVMLEYNSIDEHNGEERWDAIGVFEAGILFVVYVERVTAGGNDIIRIISARYAEKEEKKRYVSGY